MWVTGDKTECVYRRYAIVSSTAMAAEKLQAAIGTIRGTIERFAVISESKKALA